MPDVYGTNGGFSTYHTERGRDVSDYTSGEIDAALVVASEWLDAQYRADFMGYKTGGQDQVRDWPRIGAWDVYGYAIADDTIPTAVINATYELALRELQSPGAMSVDYTPSKYTSVSIDGALSVRYADRSASDVQKQFPIVAEIMSVLIDSGGRSNLSGASYRA